MESLETRKKDHIDLAFKSQTGMPEIDRRFHYEPMLAAHPKKGLQPFTFLGREHSVPMWVSSMTGGTKLAGTINRNLARACREFGMGMGLGSCRIILNDNTYFDDFNMRPIIGPDMPLWANLGIAQIEELLEEGKVSLATALVEKLEADGLIIHVNPMQEWFQPEGDVLKHPPIDTIKRFMDKFKHPLIVKEVGQGIGPESLRALLQLPLQAIEFAAFGGTNFARVELLRDENAEATLFEPLSYIGEDALTMVESVNTIIATEKPVCGELIISGGIKNFLDGYYLVKKSKLPAIYGMASTFLKYAKEDYDQLHTFVEGQVKGLEMAYAYLSVK
jgi:isopentenyl-diphosphate Delta-isomerase